MNEHRNSNERSDVETRLQHALEQLASVVPDSTHGALRPSEANVVALSAVQSAPRGRRRPMLFAAAACVVAAAVTTVVLRSDEPYRSTITSASTTVAPPEPGVPVALPAADIPDGSILYLPDPMPAGWHVWGVLRSGEFEMDWEESGQPLDAEPPISDGMFREYMVLLGNDAGTARAELRLSETPFEAAPIGTWISAGPKTDAGGSTIRVVGGLERIVIDSDDSSRARNPRAFDQSLTTALWVQDAHKFELTVGGDRTDLDALMEAVRHVDGATLAQAIADGQRAATLLPALASADLGTGLTARALGFGDQVMAVCLDTAPRQCMYAGLLYGWPEVIIDSVTLGDGKTVLFGWVPPELVSKVVAPPETIDQGIGAFLVGGSELMVKIEANSFEAVGAPRNDWLGHLGTVEVPAVTASASVKGQCESQLNETVASLTSGLPTYDYDAAKNLSALIDRTDVVVTGTLQSIVRGPQAEEPMSGGFTVPTVVDAQVLSPISEPMPPVPQFSWSSYWALGQGPDPLVDPVSIEGLEFVAFLHYSADAVGSYQADVQGLVVGCAGSSTAAVPVIAALPNDAVSLSISELRDRVRNLAASAPYGTVMVDPAAVAPGGSVTLTPSVPVSQSCNVWATLFGLHDPQTVFQLTQQGDLTPITESTDTPCGTAPSEEPATFVVPSDLAAGEYDICFSGNALDEGCGRFTVAISGD